MWIQFIAEFRATNFSLVCQKLDPHVNTFTFRVLNVNKYAFDSYKYCRLDVTHRHNNNNNNFIHFLPYCRANQAQPKVNVEPVRSHIFSPMIAMMFLHANSRDKWIFRLLVNFYHTNFIVCANHKPKNKRSYGANADRRPAIGNSEDEPVKFNKHEVQSGRWKKWPAVCLGRSNDDIVLNIGFWVELQMILHQYLHKNTVCQWFASSQTGVIRIQKALFRIFDNWFSHWHKCRHKHRLLWELKGERKTVDRMFVFSRIRAFIHPRASSRRLFW